MNSTVRVMDPGMGVSIQDGGRLGMRAYGVPVSGALDIPLMMLANALVNNAPDAATLEICLAGPTLKVLEAPIQVALTGNVSATIVHESGRTHGLPAGRGATLQPGETLSVGSMLSGTGYLAVSGGILTEMQLSSRSSYARAGLGGIRGRNLQAGDRLPCLGISAGCEQRGPNAGVLPRRETIRVLLGPQDDHFDRPALDLFLQSTYTVTPLKDRMGMRLAGPALSHNARGADIISDATVPGAIQVPANGQPIVLLADCQTSGGYPKIATVIRADLPLLAHFAAGDTLRFAAVDHHEARAALQAQQKHVRDWVNGMERFSPATDPDLKPAAEMVAGSDVGGDAGLSDAAADQAHGLDAATMTAIACAARRVFPDLPLSHLEITAPDSQTIH
jgi:biotin-dependent carboxylase-like uncharacterized protein